MEIIKKIVLTILLLCTTAIFSFSQVVNSKVIDNRGSGPYKAIAVKEATLPDYVIYRPENIESAAKREDKLPILVFANGGCFDTSITHEKVLSEVASHGYIVIAIGALQMKPDDRERKKTDASMLTDAIDWITTQNANEKSAYYQHADLNNIASGGQSCGGAQVLAVASDSRIKAYMMFNSGIGDMSMAGGTKESLQDLHAPIVYLVGGPSDVAYSNAELDYERIRHVPVAFTSLAEGGHMGTFGEKYGGSFARMALKWLDWQLKGQKDNADVFVKNEVTKFPEWTVTAKNFNN